MQWNVRCWRDDDIDAEDKVDEVTSNVGIVVVALKYISMNVRVCARTSSKKIKKNRRWTTSEIERAHV